MKNIRNNVFETNSSSSHSISITESSDGVLDTIECDEDGVITIVGDGFGREWTAYNEPRIKAGYCMCDNSNNPAALELLREVIMEHTGCSKVEFKIDSNSYVDHQSVGTSADAFVDKETLKRFIFDPESYIFTGSDESSPPPNFYDVGKNIVFTHQLEIEGIDLVFKFTEIPSAVDLKEAIDSIMDRHPLNKYSCNYEYDQDGYEIPQFNYFSTWERTDIFGNKFSSLTNFNQGIIFLYKLEAIYDNKNSMKYLGEKILEKKKISFRIVPIKKEDHD